MAELEKDVSGLDAVFGEGGVSLVELDELHAEAAALAVVAGHDQEDAVGELHLGARGHEGGRVAGHGSPRFRRRRQTWDGVEELMDFGFGEDVHEWGVV